LVLSEAAEAVIYVVQHRLPWTSIAFSFQTQAMTEFKFSDMIIPFSPAWDHRAASLGSWHAQWVLRSWSVVLASAYWPLLIVATTGCRSLI
jgi:hypothetical protein